MQTPSSFTSPGDAWAEIRQRLQTLRLRERKVTVSQGFLFLGVAVCGIALVLGVAEAVFRFSAPYRFILVLTSLVGILALTIWRCIFPYLLTLSDDSLGRRVDRHFPDLHDRVTMTLQLWRQRTAQLPDQSSGLLNAAIVASAEATKTVDFSDADARYRIPQAGKLFGGTAAGFLTAFTLFFVPLSSAFERLSNPLTDYPVPQLTFVTLKPGNIEIPMGGSVAITASVTGEIPDEATLHLIRSNQTDRAIALPKTTKTTFSHTARGLNRSVSYMVEVGDAVSPRFTINVVDRPIVSSMNLTYEYPKYTRLAPRTTADGSGDIVALKGTNVTVTIKSSQSLTDAQLFMAGTKREQEMTVTDREGKGTLLISQNDQYQILIRNESGRNNGTPPQYQITALSDRLPDVRIISPGQDTDLTENMMVPLVISASDDFGFSRMNLVYQKVTDQEQTKKYIPMDRQVTTFTAPFVWDLLEMGLFPEDVVSYFIEVFDNDTISGPKRAVSQTFTVRFPSMAEIYENLDAQQEQQVAEIGEMLKDHEEAQEKLQNLNRDLEHASTPDEEKDLTWEQKNEIESLVVDQEKMAENVLQAAEAMAEVMQRLEQQDMMNLELVEKMNQLRKLFQEISSPELMQALKNIKQSMQNMDQSQLSEAMKDFEKEQAEFKKRLERSLSILKRMQAEQKMESAVKKAQDLVERQEELQYATQNDSENPSQQTRESLSEKQQELRQDTEAMRQGLEELARSMEQIQGNMPSEEVQQAAQSMEQQGIAQQMRQISRQLASGQMQQAQRGQQQTGEQLSQMSQQLKDAQSQMQQEQQQQVTAEMRQAMHNLVELSQGQEALQSRTSQANGPGSRLPDIQEDQRSLLNGTALIADALVNMAQKTFFVSPQVGHALGESLNRMQDASRGLSKRNRNDAAQQQTDAMEALNQTVLALQQAMNDMNASGSSSGLMEMLQQLQGMSQQQSGLNDELNQMMQQQQGDGQSGQQQISMEERARVARLAQEQEHIRKSLEQMQREQRQQTDVLGRLSEIEREMKESVRQLQQQQMDPKLIERQQRILSRLLDASRSMRERDYKDERKATAGEDLASRPSPSELPPGLF
ncbi:MAG: DUF4175 family protein, partial [Gemmatimonadota bacterium]|nr:DUF4175 family protein [Gemmatimonadota bacterium]